MVIPVGKGFLEYAEEVRSSFHAQHMFVDVDTSGNTLQKKVRSAQLAQYNFVFSEFLHVLFPIPQWQALLTTVSRRRRGDARPPGERPVQGRHLGAGPREAGFDGRGD